MLGSSVSLQLPYDPFLYLKAVNEGIPIVVDAPRSAPGERLVKFSQMAFGADSSVVPAMTEFEANRRALSAHGAEGSRSGQRDRALARDARDVPRAGGTSAGLTRVGRPRTGRGATRGAPGAPPRRWPPGACDCPALRRGDARTPHATRRQRPREETGWTSGTVDRAMSWTVGRRLGSIEDENPLPVLQTSPNPIAGPACEAISRYG